MFTGLVKGMGEVMAIRRFGGECVFSFKTPFIDSAIADGESIAVNGACLSVEKHDDAGFSAYASEETMARTNLGFLKTGDSVNMERAIAFGERLGGHLVSGHVDCLAKVGEVRKAGRSIRCLFSFPAEFGPQVIPKGSVALDGISLTVNFCGADYLEVNLIPDTQARTTAHLWKKGYAANMETDLIGKYVLGLARPWENRELAESGAARKSGRVTLNFLGENGFL